MKVINFFGGPGISKSTCAMHVAAELKWLGVNAEYVKEFAKDAAWEQRSDKFWKAQTYISANQLWHQQLLMGDCDIAISDSPIILAGVYAPEDTPETNKIRFDLLLREFNEFHNINILLTRCKPYNPKGRNQTENQARDLDEKIKSMLILNHIPFATFTGERSSIPNIVNYVMDHK